MAITESCDCSTVPNDYEISMYNAQLKCACLYGTYDEILDTIKNIKHDQTRKNLSQKYGVNI